MEWTMWTRECLCCGVNQDKVALTAHHVLPKRMKPKSNLTISLCDTCHKKWHEIDVHTIESQLLGILKGNVSQLSRLTDIIKDNNVKLSGEEDE